MKQVTDSLVSNFFFKFQLNPLKDQHISGLPTIADCKQRYTTFRLYSFQSGAKNINEGSIEIIISFALVLGLCDHIDGKWGNFCEFL